MFEIGFLTIRFWDILDIVIVGYLMYQIYRLLRGSLAFNIFIGVITIYVLYWLVGILQMDLLAALLDQFVRVGVIVLIIIFQPEVRRFLLFLGNTTLRQRSNFWGRLLTRNINTGSPENLEKHAIAIRTAMINMSAQHVGALIVITKGTSLDGIISSGTPVNTEINQLLLESIFSKTSPLHDGAVIIADGQIKTASAVLPVSDSSKLPRSAGLRHRAAVGVTERADVSAFIVSEETGWLSFAHEGKLVRKLSEERIEFLLKKHL